MTVNIYQQVQLQMIPVPCDQVRWCNALFMHKGIGVLSGNRGFGFSYEPTYTRPEYIRMQKQ